MLLEYCNYLYIYGRCGSMRANFIDGSKISPYCIISCLFAERNTKSGYKPGKKSISEYVGTYNKNKDKTYMDKKEEKAEGMFSDTEKAGDFSVQSISKDENINMSTQTLKEIAFSEENPGKKTKPVPVVEEPEELYGINKFYGDSYLTQKEEKSQNEVNIVNEMKTDLSGFKDENCEVPTVTSPKVIEISFSSLLELLGGFLGDISDLPLSSLIKITKLPDEIKEESQSLKS